jgi:hypothetical protein
VSASEESLTLLRSIDTTLKALLALSQQRTARVATGGGKAVADARELDSKYGDPEIKAADPRDWSGPTMKGRRLSQCPPQYLDLFADRCDYFATKADEKGEKTEKGKPRSEFLRKDAARARGWAARIRSGWKPAEPAVDTVASWGDSSEAWK